MMNPFGSTEATWLERNSTAKEMSPTRTSTISPHTKAEVIGTESDLCDEKLKRIGLTKELLLQLLSMFSKRFGKERALSLDIIILWHADITGLPNSANFGMLAEYVDIINPISVPADASANTDRLIEILLIRCLVTESCAHGLKLTFGDDWHEAMFSIGLDPSTADKIIREMRRIYTVTFPDVSTVCTEMMEHIVEYTFIQRRQEFLLEELELEERQKKEVLGELEKIRNSIRSANTQNVDKQKQAQHHPYDQQSMRNQWHSNNINDESIATSIANNNRSSSNNNNNIISQLLTQQNCMQPQYLEIPPGFLATLGSANYKNSSRPS